jgi:HEPN domain-containing protein
MGYNMHNRTTFQDIANIRLEEAKTLLDHGKYSGAYYLSGYVIECALKACIAKDTREYDFPPKRGIVDKIYSHDLNQLLSHSSLKALHTQEIVSNRQLEVNWAIVINWSEESRYEKHEQREAEELFNAVSDINGGVFEWIKQHW